VRILILTLSEGGPAGSSIASLLAHSVKAPQVLLLEAGGPNTDLDSRALADRYNTFHTHPHYNYGYKTTPQKHLLNREIDFSRGRGLGGSSAINFAFWTRGPAGDWDEWAKILNDDFFNAVNAERRFKKIEGYGPIANPDHRKYVNPSSQHHGYDGPVKITFPKEWERTLEPELIAAREYGMPTNLDINSGNPIGNGISPATAYRSIRVTAATAYLSDPPINLHIVTNAQATKIIFKDKKAVGVQAGGKEYYAQNDIIISAGALDTPKLLLLSGIGPKHELVLHGITSVLDLPGVGKNLQDHTHLPITVQIQDGKDDRAEFTEPAPMQAARAQFEKDGTGPLTILFNTAIMGWFRDEKVYASKEFRALPEDMQSYIKRPTVPTWEQAVLCPTLTPLSDPKKTYLTNIAFGMINQSRGTVTLASANATDAPVCDPNFMDHPFDRMKLTHAIRMSYGLLTSPLNAKDTVAPFMVPKSMSDEDIWVFIQENLQSTYHMAGTAKMGGKDDEMAVVDTDFKVRGVEGLRVADMSVIPLLPSCHTVSTAYQIGNAAAERLIAEYGLDG
jgi:choline dehydrogenase-like flavoprotein